MSRTDDALQACESGRSADADDPVEAHADEVEHYVDVVPDLCKHRPSACKADGKKNENQPEQDFFEFHDLSSQSLRPAGHP